MTTCQPRPHRGKTYRSEYVMGLGCTLNRSMFRFRDSVRSANNDLTSLKLTSRSVSLDSASRPPMTVSLLRARQSRCKFKCVSKHGIRVKPLLLKSKSMRLWTNESQDASFNWPVCTNTSITTLAKAHTIIKRKTSEQGDNICNSSKYRKQHKHSSSAYLRMTEEYMMTS